MTEDWLKFIPLDKSWIIRMGILDLINGYPDIKNFLEKEKDLSDDLQALKRAAENWASNSPLDVGESGTLYRFVKFYLWKNHIGREIKTSGTLTERSKNMCNNPEIVNWPPEKLLELDNETSQWATAAYLLGDRRKVSNPPFKLQVTYDAVEHWEKQRKEAKVWEARCDNTILNQASAFVNLPRNHNIAFAQVQAEDYCFARAFGLIDETEGEQRFPSLIGHETNRIEEMKKAINQADNDEQITSRDHRIVQAIVMRQIAMGKEINVADKGCVNKTWPKFWDFIDYCKKNLL
jgi:hypothetical protein